MTLLLARYWDGTEIVKSIPSTQQCRFEKDARSWAVHGKNQYIVENGPCCSIDGLTSIRWAWVGSYNVSYVLDEVGKFHSHRCVVTIDTRICRFFKQPNIANTNSRSMMLLFSDINHDQNFESPTCLQVVVSIAASSIFLTPLPRCKSHSCLDHAELSCMLGFHSTRHSCIYLQSTQLWHIAVSILEQSVSPLAHLLSTSAPHRSPMGHPG